MVASGDAEGRARFVVTDIRPQYEAADLQGSLIAEKVRTA